MSNLQQQMLTPLVSEDAEGNMFYVCLFKRDNERQQKFSDTIMSKLQRQILTPTVSRGADRRKQILSKYYYCFYA